MKQPTGKLAMAYQTIARMKVEIENLRTVQRASFNASGQIKAAASELGFNPAQEEGALEYLIGLAREVTGLRKRVADLSPFKGAPLTGPDTRCLACGGYHYGLGSLPCPVMKVTAQEMQP